MDSLVLLRDASTYVHDEIWKGLSAGKDVYELMREITLPEELSDSTWVELAAASPVRTSGMVFALEQLKVGSISGSAQRMMRGTFTFFFQNAFHYYFVPAFS